MRRLLLTIEQAFSVAGRLVIVPDLVDLRTSQPPKHSIDDWWPDYPRLPAPLPTEVELRRPDGSTRTVACRFIQSHLNYTDAHSDKPPGFKPAWVYVCHLQSISKEEVTPGTEVWYESDG